MFETVLVANRGEIAVRILRTLREMGIRSVAVHSDADARAAHVRHADVAVRIGPEAAGASYLDVACVLAAAEQTGAQAIHPGYGFLSENAGFARACAGAGTVFIGPPPEAIEQMGDKIRAKRLVGASGVPVVPGTSEPGLDDGQLTEAATRIGFPLMVKAAAGGGGKGMRVVGDRDALAGALASARREARGAFGDDSLLLERYLQRPRHIEVQVLADTHGRVLHVGERECSLQRRHQKIVEECPSPLVDDALRARMGEAAVDAARACAYVGAGTVEFIVDRRGQAFYFLEMNTRLQVEHPVTEEVYGLDLVAWQVRIAAGDRIDFAQEDLRPGGHAVEARVYAEDPARGFLPTGGRILDVGAVTGARVDSGIERGVEVGSAYDPLLAKVVAHASDRGRALDRLDRALAEHTVLGVVTNVAFLRSLLQHPQVRGGELDTGLVERCLDELVEPGMPDDVAVAAAMAFLLGLEPAGPTADPFELTGGWRIGEPAWTRLRLRNAAGETVDVRVRGRARDAEARVGGGEALPARAWCRDGELVVEWDGTQRAYRYAEDGDAVWLGRDGAAWVLREEDELAASRHADDSAIGGEVAAPMPGTVTVVHAGVGDEVIAGQTLLVVEAMKMEHPITAPLGGVVTALPVRAGDRVAMEQHLATVTSPEAEAAEHA